jgi:hypothetical protein
MQNYLTSTLQQLYEANLRSLQYLSHDRAVTTRILNTNDHIINALTTLMSRRYGMGLPNLNSEEPQPTNTILPNIIPPPPPPQPQPQMFVAPGPAPGLMFHAPVPVFPSPAQIQESIRNVTFLSLENPINDACPISLNAFQPFEVVSQIRGCGHLFNRAQLGIWLRTNCRCPVCRFDVRTYVAANNLYDLDDDNAAAMGEYETTLNQNATAIFNLLSNPTGGDTIVRDLSGNSFNIRSFYHT